MATTQKRLRDRIQFGVGLLSMTVAIAAVGIVLAVNLSDDPAVRVVIWVLCAIAIGVLWTFAVGNARVERAARTRLQEEHPGALVERVRLWSLPAGRVDRDLPIHFAIADATEVSFETIDQTVLLRIPVADLGFVDLVTAQGDTARDKALTLIYGDDQHTTQFFTITYASMDRLRSRVRTAIGWPATDTP